MKPILSILLLTLCLTCTAEIQTPRLVKAERILQSGDPSKPGVIVQMAASINADTIQVQRKLFPWGWRNIGSMRADNWLFLDRHPSKRGAAYRVRGEIGGETYEWSNVVKVKAISK